MTTGPLSAGPSVDLDVPSTACFLSDGEPDALSSSNSPTGRAFGSGGSLTKGGVYGAAGARRGAEGSRVSPPSDSTNKPPGRRNLSSPEITANTNTATTTTTNTTTVGGEGRSAGADACVSFARNMDSIRQSESACPEENSSA
ncbi:unnamed protein product, partial [Laminaria digitata]